MFSKHQILDSMLNQYWFNEITIKMNPMAYDIMWDNEVLYGAMLKMVPQSHYDEINLIVYGIRRV
jgi:hypothetical protein